MKIVIIGPGSAGSLLYAFLSRTEHVIAILDKDPARTAFLRRNGIRIEGGPCSGGYPAKVYASARDIPATVDLLFFCVKSFDTAYAVQHALPLIEKDTTLVSFQNGLGNAETIMGLSGSKRVLCAVTSHGITRLDTGKIRHAGEGLTSAAAAAGSSLSGAENLAAILNACGMKTRSERNCDSMLWSKLVVNAAINPLTALWSIPNGGIIKDPAMKTTALSACREAADTASAKGIDLLFDSPEAEVERVCRLTAGNISSMLQDVRRGRRTEIEAITGTIVREAESLGVPAPTNRKLLERFRSKHREPQCDQNTRQDEPGNTP